ncbi:phage tail tape measure protein, partial [Arthrospira platensis SPKY1]|nr:phage tail tape measure protein [Arthrospira platensis SPKY1]
DTALVDLSKVVDISKSQMEDMRVSALSLAKDLGQSSVDIVGGMAEFGRVTKDLTEIKELTKTATMASNVTDLSASDAAAALNTTMIAFKINAKDSMKILDQFNEIQNNFRTSGE